MLDLWEKIHKERIGIFHHNVLPQESINDSVAAVCVLARDMLKYINGKINLFLGRDYTLGHSYFWNLSQADNGEEAMGLFKEDLFEQIFPQMEELFRGREEQMMHILGISGKRNNMPYLLLAASDEEIEMGAIDSYIQNPEITPQELVEWAKGLCVK